MSEMKLLPFEAASHLGHTAQSCLDAKRRGGDQRQARANRFKRDSQDAAITSERPLPGDGLDGGTQQFFDLGQVQTGSSQSVSQKNYERCMKYTNALRNQKDQLASLIENLKNERIE